MKSLLRILACTSSLALACLAHSDPVDLTPENLRHGIDIVVSGKVNQIEDFFAYPEESYNDAGKLKTYYAYRLKTGVLSNHLIFYSKVERQAFDEVTIIGRLTVHLSGSDTKGNGILKLLED
ncbi:hypothetical protein [uncultured Endozoicomonas sp.]|uniref:hypothetical protein n=1 Tax=uncultured Endozoicomonas sp. TaxID=432652 RepID=UPI002628997F|nr:hypothetical protein [uncultured Endozoicomonas sp.]